MLAELTGIIGVDGTFVDRSLSFDTGGSVSGNLTLVFRSETLTAFYDNVRLSTTSIPEPATAGLAALLVFGMVLHRRRGN